MKKKTYIAPVTATHRIELQTLVMGSQLNQSQDSQNITTTEEEYEEKFTSRRHDIWEDEEDDY